MKTAVTTPVIRSGGTIDVTETKRLKLQFWIDEAEAESLKKLAAETNQQSVSDLIRNALSVYAWSTRKIKQGGELQLIDADGKTHIVVFPGFSG